MLGAGKIKRRRPEAPSLSAPFKGTLLVNSPQRGPTVHLPLLPPLEIKASPSPLGACCLPWVLCVLVEARTLARRYLLSNKVSACVSSVAIENLLQLRNCVVTLILQHVFSSTKITNTAKLSVGQLYKKASRFKKLQHSYLYILFIFHEYVERCFLSYL